MKRKRLDFRKASPSPLIVLAGLPFPICSSTARYLELEYPGQPKVVFQSSGADNLQLYRSPLIDALIRAVSSYAERQRKAGESLAIPDHVMLAYVPSPDDEHLLAEFQFFAFAVPLSRLAEYDEHGRQFRHNPRMAQEYALSLLRSAHTEFLELKRKLSTPSEREPLLLPPDNFEPNTTTRIASLFADIFRRRTHWKETMADITMKRVTKNELPKLPAGASRTVMFDSRGLLFPIDRSNHGPVRELDTNSTIRERTLFLRSCFRFGARLTDGFHHDVQLPGRPLNGVRFQCSHAGIIAVDGTHANVYPNDHVRPKN